jgi:hypothetical protein
MDGRKLSYFYPEIIENVYQSLKNPREKCQKLLCPDGENIIDKSENGW